MENQSPFLAMRRLEGQLQSLLRMVDIDLLTSDEKRAVSTLRRLAADARLDTRDYELSETRQEQLTCAAAAQKRLEKLRRAILAAGDAFGPADVAQLGAQCSYIANLVR